LGMIGVRMDTTNVIICISKLFIGRSAAETSVLKHLKLGEETKSSH
jgi:hypothetical protein